MRKYFKILTAFALTATMVILGCQATASAAAATGTVQDSSGDAQIIIKGNYVGSATYPVIKVMLPTVMEKQMDYIVDPNNLMQQVRNVSGDTSSFGYGNCIVNGNTGIYFLTDTSGDVRTFSDRSKPVTITNKNAQNLLVKAKVAPIIDNSGDVVYTSSMYAATSGDVNAKSIYLGILLTNPSYGYQSPVALNSLNSVEFSTVIKGKPRNFDLNYNNDKFIYVAKNGLGDSSWNSASYQLTGAVNKNATWEDEIALRTFKMTWSWEEYGIDR